MDAAAAIEAVDAWAASGAMHLTGRADGPPLGPPAPLVPGLRAIADRISERTAALGRPVVLDPLKTLAQRVAILGLSRGGTVSCGGSSRLLRAADGWIAVSLPRADDLDLIPAWLGLQPAVDPWPAVADAVARRAAVECEREGASLGLAVAALPTTRSNGDAAKSCLATRVRDAPATVSLDGVVVADLSALWAGPLCGAMLAAAGATVMKVETAERPDGSRATPAFFARLNNEKHHRTVTLDELAGVIAEADVVIESSRPRALRHLGIDAAALLHNGRPRVWMSITGHGRAGAAGNRVGFGDDAAVAGGLVVWEADEPRFCADAVADPATGLAAAAACLDALASGGAWLLDVALSRVAASLAGPTLPVPNGVVADAPRPS